MRDAAGGWRRRPLLAQLRDVGAGLGLVVAGAIALSGVGVVLALLAGLLAPVTGP